VFRVLTSPKSRLFDIIWYDTDSGLNTDARMQPDFLYNRLLQLCAAWNSIQHHPGPASPEQRGAYRSTSGSTVRLTSTRCFRRCTGCLLNSTSTTSWPCWRSKLGRRHLRSIWASTSRCAPAHATLDRRPSHCCACHFDGHHSPDDRSALPHLWLGTNCHLRLSLFSNPQLNVAACFLLLSVNFLTRCASTSVSA